MGVTVEMFEKEEGKYIHELAQQLKDKSWNPESYLSVEIRKNETEMRKLGLLLELIYIGDMYGC